jgi:predicted DNA-binding transcriptional regulator AlpA
MDDTFEKWINVDQTLEYLNQRGVQITKSSLYSHISRYKLPRSYKIRGRLRFKISDLDDWIRSITKDR